MVIGNADFKDQSVLLLTAIPICRQSQRLNTSRARLGAWLVWAPPVETQAEYAQPNDWAVALPPGYD